MDRRVFAGLVTASVLVLALVLVARGNAGSDNATLATFAAPTQLSPGATGLAGTQFTPAGKGNHGTATHVVLTLTLPAGSSWIAVTTCPGSSSISGVTAACAIKNVHNGQTVKMFATYTGVASGAVVGNAVWDVPKRGGATGAQNTITSSSDNVTVNTEGGTFAGQCAQLGSTTTLQAAGADNTKQTTLVFGTVDGSLGFPCTPGEAGVEPTTVHGHTPGVWSLSVAPLANGGLATATLRLNDVVLDPYDYGTGGPVIDEDDVARTLLYEIDPANGILNEVPWCQSGALPQGADACLTDKVSMQPDSVVFSLKVLGTGTDPRFTS